MYCTTAIIPRLVLYMVQAYAGAEPLGSRLWKSPAGRVEASGWTWGMHHAENRRSTCSKSRRSEIPFVMPWMHGNRLIPVESASAKIHFNKGGHQVIQWPNDQPNGHPDVHAGPMGNCMHQYIAMIELNQHPTRDRHLHHSTTLKRTRMESQPYHTNV